MVYLLDAAIESEAQAQENPVLKAKADAPGIQPASGGNGAEPRPAPANRDPAQELLEAIVDGDFSRRETIACGAFLSEFDRDREILFGVDLEGMKLLRRGRNWVLAEAPYRSSPAHRVGPEADRGVVKARVRFVQTGEAWKVENVEVIP